MLKLANFVQRYGVHRLAVFLDILNDIHPHKGKRIASMLHVSEARVSQWVDHFFIKRYIFNPELEPYLDMLRREGERHHDRIAKNSLEGISSIEECGVDSPVKIIPLEKQLGGRKVSSDVPRSYSARKLGARV